MQKCAAKSARYPKQQRDLNGDPVDRIAGVAADASVMYLSRILKSKWRMWRAGHKEERIGGVMRLTMELFNTS